MAIIGSPWTTRQSGRAGLNPAHPLAGRLLHGYVFSDGSGSTNDVVNPSTIAASTASGSTWQTNATGPTIQTGPGYINAGVTRTFPTTPFHIVCGFSNASAARSTVLRTIAMAVNGEDDSTAATWGFSFFYHDDLELWVVDARKAATYVTWPDLKSNIFDNGSSQHIHLACTASDTTLYRNGVSLGTTGAVIAGTTAWPVTIGGSSVNGMIMGADFEYFFLFSGTLTQTEIEDLRANPYSLVGNYAPPTRIYMPSTGTAPISPAFDSAWNDTSSAVTRSAATTRGSSAFAEVTDTETSSSNLWDVCLGRYVSEPLAAQTISGNVMGIIRARESNTAANARSQMVIRVVSGDGATVRGTLLAQNNTTTNINEWVATTTVTAARNARFPVGSGPVALTPVTVQQGDRLVIEVGGRAVNTSTTSYTLGMRFGENAADLADNETGTTEGAPWIEFDNAIQFYTAPPAHTVAGAIPAKKPTIVATATQTFPARSVSGTVAAKKPTIAAASTQTFPARALTSTLAASKPTFAATATQTFPARSLSGTIAATKPTITATSVQVFPTRTVSGTVAATKPAISATATQTSIARAVSGGIAAPKPGIAATATQTFPARAVTGTIAVKKPTLAATVVAPRSVSGALAAPKPAIAATAVQTFPARSITGTISAKKPTASGTAVQVFPTRAVAGTITVTKPTISAAAVQVFPARAVTGAIQATKPTISATVTSSRRAAAVLAAPKPALAATAQQVFPARAVTGAIPAKKPTIAATSVQVFPGKSLSGVLVAPKPTLSADLTSSAPTTSPFTSEFSYEFGGVILSPVVVTASIQATKPTIAATSTQTFPARALTGAIAAKKPNLAATAAQVFPARNVAGTLAAKKPTLAGTAAQVFPARSLAAALLAPKPTLTAQLFQSQIGSITISSALVAPKPAITATATQFFPARSIGGTLTAPKPALRATVTETRRATAALAAPKPSISATAVQAVVGSVSATATIAAKKPTISATAVQVFPARNVAGTLSAKKPMLTASAVHPLPPHEVTADLVAPKPTVAGSLTQSFPERLILGYLAAPKPTAAGEIIQVFPERFASAALGAPKPTISGTMLRGITQDAPHLSNTVYLTGSVNPEVRFQGAFDLDVSFTAAIETDVFLTGTIDN